MAFTLPVKFPTNVVAVATPAFPNWIPLPTLMLAAVGTHIKVKNSLSDALPALTQIFMNGLIFYLTYLSNFLQ